MTAIAPSSQAEGLAIQGRRACAERALYRHASLATTLRRWRWLLLSALLTLPAQAQSGETTWRAATEYPATAMPGEGLATFARLLAERSPVRVVPRYDAPDGLRSATIPAAVQSGRLEVGDAFAGSLAGLDPVFQLSSLPFVATTQDQARRLYVAARPAYERAFAARGQRLLYATPWPATGIWSRNPLPDAAALHALSIRTYDATSTQVMNAAGLVATELSFADAMPRLRDGSVRAVLSSGDGGAGRRLWEVTRHFLAIGYAMPLSFTTVSDTAYAALDESGRISVDAAAAETEGLQWQALAQRTARNYATMRQNGVAIAEPTPEVAAALARAGAGVVATWRAQAGPAATVLDAYRR